MKAVTIRTYLVNAPPFASDPILMNLPDDEHIIWLHPEEGKGRAGPFVVVYTVAEQPMAEPRQGRTHHD